MHTRVGSRGASRFLKFRKLSPKREGNTVRLYGRVPSAALVKYCDSPRLALFLSPGHDSGNNARGSLVSVNAYGEGKDTLDGQGHHYGREKMTRMDGSHNSVRLLLQARSSRL